jgi:hypothetical protein
MVTLRQLRKAYSAISGDEPATTNTLARVVRLNGEDPPIELVTHAPLKPWRYEGALAVSDGEFAGQHKLDPQSPDAPALLEYLIARDHGDRFPVVAVRSLDSTAHGLKLVAEVVIVFAIPWRVLAGSSGARLKHRAFELPLTREQMLELRECKTLAQLVRRLDEIAGFGGGGVVVANFRAELRYDGRNIEDQLRELRACLDAGGAP